LTCLEDLLAMDGLTADTLAALRPVDRAGGRR
jgi:hypothetical protein